MKTPRRWLPITARLFLALPFLIFGLNKLFHFLPLPPSTPAGGAFMGAMVATGYMLPLIALTEIVAGGLLIANRKVPLALVLLAPVMVQIVAFHLFLAPAGLPVPLVLMALQGYLVWTHRAAFAPLLRDRTSVGSDQAGAEPRRRNELANAA